MHLCAPERETVITKRARVIHIDFELKTRLNYNNILM